MKIAGVTRAAQLSSEAGIQLERFDEAPCRESQPAVIGVHVLIITGCRCRGRGCPSVIGVATVVNVMTSLQKTLGCQVWTVVCEVCESEAAEACSGNSWLTHLEPRRRQPWQILVQAVAADSVSLGGSNRLRIRTSFSAAYIPNRCGFPCVASSALPRIGRDLTGTIRRRHCKKANQVIYCVTRSGCRLEEGKVDL